MLCNVCLVASRDKLAAFYIKMDDKYQIKNLLIPIYGNRNRKIK